MNTQTPLQTLKSIFGFDAFREGQQAVIETLLATQSALAVFPTGSGKSLCYQLPALYFSGLTLVVSPLIALMKDQVDFLQSRNIRAARLDSSLDWDETRQVYDDLRARQQMILFVAPERLSNERFIQTLQGQAIDLMVIDEAHCISEWGHNFRPEYLKLAKMATALQVQRVLALTATATPNVADDICREFKIDPEAYIHTGFYRPNLTLNFSVCQNPTDKQTQLLERLQQAEPGPTIVYVTLQKTAEMIAQFLSDHRFESQPYHAGMQTDARNAVQDWFMASDSAIVVATIAFGMGIDKSNIRYIYHYNLPKTLENYSQEIGRAGRDGTPSTCEIFASSDDVTILENFIYGDTPEEEALNPLVDFIIQQDDEFDVGIYELANQYDIRPLVVRTVLTYLELLGVIESTAPFYAEYRFQPQHPSAEILAQFDQTRADFLRQIFSQAKKGRTWFSINLTVAAATIGQPRERIVRALNYLEEQEQITLKVAQARQGYRLLKPATDIAALQAKLYQRFMDNEANNISRLQQMMALVEHQGCQVKQLLAYFGETKTDECGHCGWCLHQTKLTYPHINTEAKALKPTAITKLLQGTSLTTPRQKTRFLCGITSPLISKQRLRSHANFGALTDIPFQQVLQAVEVGDYPHLKRNVIEIAPRRLKP